MTHAQCLLGSIPNRAEKKLNDENNVSSSSSSSSSLHDRKTPSSWATANGGVTNRGLRGIWPPSLEIGRNRPFSPFFCLFLPSPEGAKSSWKIQKTEEKGLFLKYQICLSLANSPGQLQESSGPFGPEVSRGVFRECPRKRGVSDRVSHGVLWPQAPECPKSVPRVSLECSGDLFDTPGTLSGHFFGHSGARGARRAPETPPWDTPSDTPRFRGHSGTLPGTLRARRARKTPVAGRLTPHLLNPQLRHPIEATLPLS